MSDNTHQIVVATEEILDKQDGWSNYQLRQVGDAVREAVSNIVKEVNEQKEYIQQLEQLLREATENNGER